MSLSKSEIAARVAQCELMLDDIHLERSAALKPFAERETKVNTELLELRTALSKINTSLEVGDEVSFIFGREGRKRGRVAGFGCPRYSDRVVPIIHRYLKDGQLGKDPISNYRVSDLKKEGAPQ